MIKSRITVFLTIKPSHTCIKFFPFSYSNVSYLFEIINDLLICSVQSYSLHRYKVSRLYNRVKWNRNM